MKTWPGWRSPALTGCRHSAFAGLLVGQPTLRRRINLGTFAALDQRIANLRFAMPARASSEKRVSTRPASFRWWAT